MKVPLCGPRATAFCPARPRAPSLGLGAHRWVPERLSEGNDIQLRVAGFDHLLAKSIKGRELGEGERIGRLLISQHRVQY